MGQNSSVVAKEALKTGLERHDEYLKSDGVLGEFKDANESYDAEKGERRARLCSSAAHRRQNVEQRDVVRHDRCQIDDVLEVAPEQQFRRTRDEADDDLQREPGRADGFDDEEQVEKVWRFVADAVRHGEVWQRLDTEQNDRDERYQNGHNGDDVSSSRSLRVLEVHPDFLQRGVRRQLHLVDGVAFRHLVLVDYVPFQLVELGLGEENVVGDVMWSAQSTADLVVGEDGLEARSMSVEEDFVSTAVVEGRSTSRVTQQCIRMTLEQPEWDLEVVSTDVDTNSTHGRGLAPPTRRPI